MFTRHEFAASYRITGAAVMHTSDIEPSAHFDESFRRSPSQSSAFAQANQGSVFDMCLILSVVLCVLELAVQLLKAQTLFQMAALLLSVASWAVVAISIELIIFNQMQR